MTSVRQKKDSREDHILTVRPIVQILITATYKDVKTADSDKYRHSHNAMC